MTNKHLMTIVKILKSPRTGTPIPFLLGADIISGRFLIWNFRIKFFQIFFIFIPNHLLVYLLKDPRI